MIRLLKIAAGKRHSIAMLLWLLLLSVFCCAEVIAADAILNVDAKTNQVDLALYRTPIAAERSSISIQGPGDPQPLELKAKGLGPTYYWSLFSFNNAGAVDLNFILAIEPQKFSGSGLLSVKSIANAPVAAVSTNGVSLESDDIASLKTYNFTVPANKTFNIAIENNAPDLSASLWQRKAFINQTSNASFYQGLIIGMGLLITFGILALHGFRPNASLLAGLAFALSGMAFVLFESVEAHYFTDQIIKQETALPIVRAIIESAMTISLLVCVMVFTKIRTHRPIVGLALIFILSGMFANLVFVFVDPNRAASIARIGFAGVATIGFVLTAFYRSKIKAMVDPGLLFWTAIFAWTVFAGVASQAEQRISALSPLLTAALVATLIALLLVLVKYVFSQGLAARPFITDSSRRSLALTGAMHYLWDWQPQDKHLDIGDELPKALGYIPVDWRLSPLQTFLNVIHPNDVLLYQTEVEDSRIAIGQVIDLELRLRNAKGQYQWFALRARAIPGTNNQLDRCIGTLTDISRSKETEERLVQDAVHDPVTGLPSRALFMDRLERELTKPVAFPVRFLLVDLDRFKTLNEALGHDYGDRLLLMAGARILECLAPDESVARISGSQFAVLVVEAIARRSASALAEEISKALSVAIELPQQDVFLTASIGISHASSRGITAGMLQQQASSALLEARKRGGAQTVIFDVGLKDERAAQLALESDLRRAMASDEIEVQYQPIAHLNSLDIAGFEALARWRHPVQGVLPPAQFIDMAEQAGMISEIGQIVLAQAARQLGIWQRVLRHDRPFFVSVNISPSHLLEKNFLEQVQSILNREGLNSNSLKIEVTESVIMRHPERAARLFERLRSLGVGLACDDFGTGFSSLSSLRDLPFDTLKIDRSFIAAESFDHRSGMIITSITELAHSLDMVVVAEGIESQSQVDKLAQLGCDLGQGYLIGQAMAASEVTDMLAVLPRIIAKTAPEISPINYMKRDVEILQPGLAPMAPRRAIEVVEEPEELPSIFAVGNAQPKPEPKTRLAQKRAKPKPAVKRAKKR